MPKTVDQYFDDLRGTRVWRSIFRSGTGSSTLKRALAIREKALVPEHPEVATVVNNLAERLLASAPPRTLS